MSKLLRTLVGVVALGIIFVLGWWYGEKNTSDQANKLGFTTQSVWSNDENTRKPTVSKTKQGLSVYKFSMDENAEPLWSNTAFVECPWASLPTINIELWWDLIPKITDPTNNTEVSMYGFQLNFIATKSTQKAKFIKAVRTKQSLVDGQCIYATLDDHDKSQALIVYNIKLVDGCKAVQKWFECDR